MASLVVAALAWAGNTGTTALFKPIGNTASSASGDYISTSSGGLNTYYSYFIEVPPGQGRLVVDIFDADVGAGGDADRTGNRDWDYAGTGWSGTTSYSLLSPAGSEVPVRLRAGSTTAPAGADAAWLTFFDSSDTGGTFRDQFDSRSYTNNNGSYFWPEGWTEVGDDGTAQSPTSGSIQILNNVSNYQLQVRRNASDNSNASIYRTFSLVGATSATLTFAYRRVGFDTSGDHVYVEASTDGATYTQLQDIAGPTNDPTFLTSSLSLATFVGQPNVYLRFRTAVNADNDTVWFDDVQVQTTNATTPVTAGHWELRVSLAAAGSDDINAYGIRAHDGDSTEAGTEYNVYYQPYTQFGTDSATTSTDTVDFVNYPWVTSGCSCYANNWDGDGAGTFAFDRPDRTTNPAGWVQVGATIAASGATVWGHDQVTGWTSNRDSSNYGIWRLRHQSIEWSEGAGNIYTFYMTDFNNATAPPPPPTAQQQANSMRVYLPTDTGTAPPKPYLEQFVRMTAGPSVTPVVGTTYRLTVSVRVENPTPHSITFSSSNLVTVNVPGGAAPASSVLYVGNLTPSQGSASYTAGSGGSGTITWNPGTLAAGAGALLSYEVNATPRTAGVLPVTGTPASNGTTARYVDETGSAAARALITLGPICQVAISTNEPTQAILAGLTSHRAAQGLVVSWMTASEVGTAGYRLERLSSRTGDFEVASEQPFLPAVPEAPQGAVYHVLDRGADTRATQTYRLVEVEASGRERDLGTYELTPADGPAPELSASFVRAPRARRAAPSLPAGSDPFTALPAAGVKIAVETPGLYWVGADEIAARLQRPLAEVVAAIGSGGFALSNQGQPVAWLPAENGSGLYFVGEALDSVYSSANVYVLKPGAGVLMEPAGAPGPSLSLPLRVSATTVHAEQDTLEVTTLPVDPESDYWYWDYLEAGSAVHGRRPFAVATPALSPARAQATLTTRLFGATSTGVTGEHHAVVYVNGTQVAEAVWEGVAARAVSATFDSSLLHDGANTVEVEARRDPGVPYGFVYVDSLDLTYQRLHVAQSSSLEVATASGRAVIVDGFADAAVRVFDLGRPQRPSYLPKVGVVPGSTGYTATFTFPSSRSSVGRRYLAVSAAGVKQPARIWTDVASSLRSTANAAEYVIVTAGPFVGTAGQLAAYRAAQGLSTAVVDLEDVYDEFNAGLPSPHALRSFLAYARGSWVVPPRTVVLAGTGSYDYKDHYGLGGNIVPPLMVSTPSGLASSDPSFGCSTIGGVPDLAVGRLPVATPDELAAAIAKIQAYEAEGAAAWTGTSIVVADDPEGGFDFGADSDTLASRLGDLAADRLYLGPLSAAEVRSHLLSAWGAGAAVVTYLGHGGLDRWAQESLLALPDVATLGNGPRLPLVASLTCVIGRYDIPGFDCLGGALVRQADGGAIGVWAPSGLANHSDSLLLGQMLAESLGHDGIDTVGEACVRALADFHAGGGNPTTAILYNYFGDPMIRLRPLPPPPPPEPGGDPGAP